MFGASAYIVLVLNVGTLWRCCLGSFHWGLLNFPGQHWELPGLSWELPEQPCELPGGELQKLRLKFCREFPDCPLVARADLGESWENTLDGAGALLG